MSKMITMILNRSPYGDEYAYNALRFATALLVKDTKVNIFLLGDGVYIAKNNQTPPKSTTNIQEMLQKFLIGKVEIKVCGLCAKSRGIEKELLEGCNISSMMDLAKWVTESDQTITF
ncbi:MAG: DsrE/DsrF/TusD sulfur relay family protein [Candidatus Helarchaeota archaeon]